MLEIILGHCTWIMLIRRESLALLNKVYQFCRDNDDVSAPMSSDVVRELWHVRSLLPLFTANTKAAWHNQ
eukprot:7356507-Karenia_brevis.AAC.1